MARNPLTLFRSGGLSGDPFLSLHREMNRLFDEVMRGDPQGGRDSGATVLAPRINVSETDSEIRVSAELPGITENDIQVELNDDLLIIRGEKKLDRKDEKENFHVVEHSYGAFQRAVQLPIPVNPADVQAHFEDGVLRITLRKTAQQERFHRIQVQGREANKNQLEQASTQENVKANGGSEQDKRAGGQA